MCYEGGHERTAVKCRPCLLASRLRTRHTCHLVFLLDRMGVSYLYSRCNASGTTSPHADNET